MLKMVGRAELRRVTISLLLFISPIPSDTSPFNPIERRVAHSSKQVGLYGAPRLPLCTTVPYVAKHGLDDVLCRVATDVLGSKGAEFLSVRVK
jgi:hypothetical protein